MDWKPSVAWPVPTPEVPTPVVAESVDEALGDRGRWHFLDTAPRMGVPEAQGAFWPRFDAAMTDLVGAG